MNKWNFENSVTLVIDVLSEKYVNVLGERRWVVNAAGKIRILNVNLAFFLGGDNITLLSKGDEVPTIVISEELNGLITPFRTTQYYENKGLIGHNNTSNVNYVEYIGVNGSVNRETITNKFFEVTALKEKAKKKHVLKGEKDVYTIYSMPIVFLGKPTDTTAYDWRTTFTIGSPSDKFAYWTISSGSQGTRPKVACETDGNFKFGKLSDAYTNKIITRNNYNLNDLIANKVYDSEDALSLVTVDIYQYNGLLTLDFSSATENQYNTEKIQAFGRLRWNDLLTKTNAEIENEGSIYTSRSFGSEVTFSQSAIDETMGFSVGVIAVSAHGIGTAVEDYTGFSGYGLIKIIGGGVSDANYNIDHTNIKLVLHDYGELPPSIKSDDDKNDDNSVRGDNPPSGNTPSDTSEIGVNLLTTTYLLTKKQLNTLGDELWSPNFMNSVLMLSNSPIENILSCKIFPTTFSGVSAALKVGNVTMLSGENVQKISASGLSKDTGAVNFPQLYNSFLDFEPFTQARIFIPFVGFQPLPVANFIGSQISLRYVFDVVTGAVSVYLLRNGYIFDKYSGICAVDVPLTASNRAQVEVGQIQSAITGVAQLATGNIGGALSAGLAIASTPNHFNTRGNAGGYTSQFDPRQPYLIIDRPKAQSEISSYGETNGFPCNLTKTLSTLKGFTSVHDVHLDDVPCLESERQELKAIMQKGFII